MKIQTLFLLVFSLITTACYSIETVESTKVPTNDVYQSYLVNADKERTSVYATFHVGNSSGATIDLDAPSQIEHNGKLMRESAPNFMKGTSYEESIDQFVAKHAFVYTSADRKTFRHELIVEPLEFRANAPKISRTERTLIPLSRPVAAGEEVAAFITGTARRAATANSEQSTGDTAVLKLDESRSAIVVEPGDIKHLASGRATISLKTSKENYFKESGGGKGGSINSTYEAEEFSVTILK